MIWTHLNVNAPYIRKLKFDFYGLFSSEEGYWISSSYLHSFLIISSLYGNCDVFFSYSVSNNSKKKPANCYNNTYHIPLFHTLQGKHHRHPDRQGSRTWSPKWRTSLFTCHVQNVRSDFWVFCRVTVTAGSLCNCWSWCRWVWCIHIEVP